MEGTKDFNYGVQDGIICKAMNRFTNGIDRLTGISITLNKWLINHFNQSYAIGFKAGYKKGKDYER